VEDKRNFLIDLTILGLIAVFLLSFFEPRFLFSLTTTTGGDTGSHYPTAVYLKNVLLPAGRIMGWTMGNYAGFPLFYHYFPLPFILMALLGFIIPLQIAFKLISVLGIFLLPLSCYLTFRLLKYPFPIPIVGGLLTLPFLFMEANSMWGANIPSTLAGEIAYSLGISLGFLFLGTLYAGISERKWLLLNAWLVFLLGLSHGYSLIFGAIAGSFFLFNRQAWWYLLRVYGLGLLLLAFWLLPFIATLPYVTEYVTAWYIKSLFEVLPRILLPGLVLTLAALFLNLFDRRTWYFAYNAAVCLLLYFLGPRVGVLDIRFIPILQILAAVFGATSLLVFLGGMKQKQTLPFIVFLAVVLWIAVNITFIKGWITWNYSGFEGKKHWPLFQRINGYLSKTGPGLPAGRQGRVVYEHSPLHNAFGTERAFESLPYFAGRDTLEGLYMQSSPSSPFVFLIQSEVSKVNSGPFPQYKYSSLSTPAALPRLKLFNVTQYIVRSPEAKKFAAALPQLKKEATFDDYEIYRLTNNDGHYVVPLDYQPVLFTTTDWKQDFYNWFRNTDLLDIILVYSPHLNVGNNMDIKYTASDLTNLPRVPLQHPKPVLSEKMGNEEIVFDTNLVGYPHLIKVSYHPNWRVEGADRIYQVSPAFMLVYPKQTHVRLYFGKSVYNYVGELLSLIGLLISLFSAIIYFAHGKNLSRRPGLQ
jgi:hypothetical protein